MGSGPVQDEVGSLVRLDGATDVTERVESVGGLYTCCD